MDAPIQIVGNVVSDPELRYTPNGVPVCNFRIANTPRTFNKTTQQWEDGEALFLTCNAWKQLGENLSATLSKGMRVIVHGKLKARSFQTKDGDNRTVTEIDVLEAGPSMRYATAQVEKANSSQGQQQNQSQQQGSQSQGGFSGETGGFGSDSTWGQPAPTGGGGDSEPPF